eukprot:comp22446_c0_seq1/m.33727 comp22446_c0_seq1/g.33727  ORF comp22446_c0_seq1/g.33727 comp22446_c0_seq1/m.33727 type:complete len:794 (-) comp22446_c0_seq1:282-2663(-)
MARLPEDQAKELEQALQMVKVQAFQMKRCLDKNKLMDALKHASTMLGELRTSLLSPKSYYELYMAVSDELRHLEMYLQDEYQSPEKVSELYELVQYAGNIVPRLYLLITVGVVYIRVKESMKKEILKDLVEMCRGVQHPLRGLFLRNYLLQTTKNFLPDCLEPSGEGAGDVKDSIDYILTNFAEMNKLWVRMQHQGHSRDREKRERERQELRILVGTNLVRLSQLENVDVNVYTKAVLPGVLEQVVNCKDPIAQEYLMECIIQVFPDDFHLRSLHMFLEGCAVLHSKVNVKNILNSMIDRLAAYALREDASIPDDIQLFDIFSAHVSDVINARTDMAPGDMVSLMVSLTNLALKCFPARQDYVNKMMDYCRRVLANRNITNVDDGEGGTNGTCSKELMRLAKIPIDNYPTVSSVMQLTNYPELWLLFGYENRKALSVYVVRKVLEAREVVDNPETVTSLLTLISPLVEDQEDQPPNSEGLANDEDFIEEQTLVARLIHYCVAEDPDVQFEILNTCKKRFGYGGELRIKYTIPPMVNTALKLACHYYDARETDENWNKKAQKLFQFVHKLVTTLAGADYADLALRLFLMCASVADRLRVENLADEFMIRALLVYEESISGSKAQAAAMALIVGTLEKLSVFTQENYDKLSLKCALHSAQLLTKPDQTRAVCMSSHLFWSGKTADSGEVRNGKKVLDCLQKSLKIADTCVDSTMKMHLFVEILNTYIYYYDQHNESVTIRYLSGLIDLINTNMANVDNSEEYEQINRHFQNTLAYLRKKKAEPEEGSPSYAELNV